jgi:SAM-dependent methyltransferase
VTRTTCGGCGGGDLVQVLDLGDSPLADEFPLTADADQPRYPLGLYRCGTCTLVQVTEVVDDAVLWGGDYGFYTGASWVAAEHQRLYAADMLTRFGRLARQLTVEIACNDGTLLRHMKDAGCRTLGVDPAAGPAQIARDHGLDVRVEGFTAAVADSIVAEHGHAGLVIANNVIAHVADLADFVGGLDRLLDRHGVAVAEFQYLADLVTGNQFDHVYHEHRQFFTLTSLDRVLAERGLMARSVEQVTPQGGSLRVTIGRDGYPDHSVPALLREERWLTDPHALDGLQGRADRIRVRLRDMLWQQKRAGMRVAGYGASAKSTTLLNFCNIGPELVQYMVDTTPTKHGRYTPGTGIPIVSPTADSRQPDIYLMTVHNYLGEVMRRETLFGQHGGRWLVPIPTPVLL